MARTKRTKPGGRQRAEIAAEKQATAAATAALSTPSSNASASTSQPPVEELLGKAHTLLAQQDYELASRFLARILTTEPSNIEARELLGVCDLELGNVEEARNHFLHLVSTSSDLSSPYLYLAQLASSPQESLAHYESAVRILEVQLKELVEGKETEEGDEDEQVVEKDLRKQISGALVGMTEVYLTDLCFDPLAPEKCDLLLSKALSVSPQDPEAWICLASVRMSQSREIDALSCIEKGWQDWRGKELGDPLIPALPTRLSLTRILLELQKYAFAIELLRGIREEDEEEVEAAYLEGWAWFLWGEEVALLASAEGTEKKEPRPAGVDVGEGDEVPEKKECWEEARESLSVCEVLHRAQNHPSPEVLAHVRELLAQLDAAGIRPAQGIVDEEDLDGMEDGEGDWGDDDDDEDEEMVE
ncbi:hypothetical protein BDY24DRAFT_378030 [Mrakia frigida]|uniref:Acl4p n=1 Tax=Mrakia frigida TaxID=29902 RepID=UPI003FCBFC4F